jgi:hypothetical protein
LGVEEDELAAAQASAREAQLAIERERASQRYKTRINFWVLRFPTGSHGFSEILAAPERARERLGHDAHKEKLKRVLALDDQEIDSVLNSRREDFVQRQSAAPACTPQARVAAAAPSKAQRVVGFEPRRVSLAKAADLLDLEQSEVADAQSELVVSTATAHRRELIGAPEKAQRVVGVDADSDDKVKERLGLSESEWQSVKRENRRGSSGGNSSGTAVVVETSGSRMFLLQVSVCIFILSAMDWCVALVVSSSVTDCVRHAQWTRLYRMNKILKNCVIQFESVSN